MIKANDEEEIRSSLHFINQIIEIKSEIDSIIYVKCPL